MSENFTLEFRGSFINIKLAPGYEITPEAMDKMWTVVADACEKYDCLLVLSEGKVGARDMTMKNAFESGSTAARMIPGLRHACCFEGYKPDITTNFFKLIALHRGAEIEFFTDRRAALEWLGVAE